MTLAGDDWAGQTAHMLKEDRGFTSHPFSGTYAGDGFGVSPYPERTVRLNPSGYSENELALVLTRFVVQNADLLRQPNHYVGGWKRAEDNVFLDVSIVTHSRAEAEQICLDNQQLDFHEFAE